jgi:polyhydroxybutyrate depolymerase
LAAGSTALVVAACGGHAGTAAAKSHEASTVAPVSTSARSANQTPNSSSSGTREPDYVYVPPNLGHRPALVIALHGGATTDPTAPRVFAQVIGLPAAAQRYGFVGASLGSTNPTWKDPANISYIEQRITQLIAQYNVDPRRVYVVGYSLGGYATYRTACQDPRVAAIVTDSQAMAPLRRRPCRLTHPVSQLNMIGSNDFFPVIATAGRAVSGQQTATIWGALDGCSSVSQASQVGSGAQTVWSQCNDGSTVEEVVIQGGVHRWPGSGGSTGGDANYNGSAAAFRFLFAHALAPSSPSARLRSVRATGSKTRTVRIVVSLGEATATLKVWLSSGVTVRSHKSFALRRGKSDVVVLPVSTRNPGGREQLKVVVIDQYGRTLTFTRTVRVPKR